MPIGKYYCDYCDKQFQDTPAARKRHLQGIQHQRAKALWFDSFKDSNQFQAGGFGRGVYNHSGRAGFFQSGDSCKYFLPNPPVQSQSHDTSSERELVRYNNTGTSLTNLPPSLRPPPLGGYPPLPFIDWG